MLAVDALRDLAPWRQELAKRLAELVERRQRKVMRHPGMEFKIEWIDGMWELTLDGKTWVFQRLKQAINRVESAAGKLATIDAAEPGEA